MVDKDGYWFAPIVARPIPEAPDRVTVGVVFGNGRLEHLAVDDGLDRLKGLVSSDHRKLLEQELQWAAERVFKLGSLDELRAELGVQFEIGMKRPLYSGFNNGSLRAVRKALFSPLESARERDGGLLRDSLHLLDGEMNSLITPAVSYLRKRVKVTDLYPTVASRYDMSTIGPLSRVARSENKHLILSSVIVRETAKSHLDGIVQRTLRQAYFLKKFRNEILDRSRIDYRFVGVLQPLEASASGEARDIRNFCEQQWRTVLDEVLTPATSGQAIEMLGPQVDWVSDR